MVILKIALKSLARRRGRAWVSFWALSLAVTLLLSLSLLQRQLHQSFDRVSSQADMIIGAPAQPAHLVIYGLFRIGSPPPPLDNKIHEQISENPEISSAIPMAFGESHRGIMVTGTDNSLFESFNGPDMPPLKLSQGEAFNQPMNAVLGASVAKKTGYMIGEKLTIGAGYEPGPGDEYPDLFTISGVLQPTGSVLDDTIFVPLEGLDIARAARANNPPADWTEPGKINLILTRLHNRQGLLAMEQALKTDVTGNLEVAIPGRELETFYQFGKLLSNSMLVMAGMTLLLALITVFFNVSASLAERRSEIDMLRMLGAGSWQVILIGLLEPLLLMFVAMAAGALFYCATMMLLPLWLPENLQRILGGRILSLQELTWLLQVLAVGSLLAVIPAWRIYGRCKKIV